MLCLSGGILTTLGCTSTKIVDATLSSNELIVPISAFRSGETSWKKHIIADNPKLKYPLCIFRFTENDYSAVLMRCTHQGTELQVFGDKLQCPAHGSEFSNRGNVLSGPADTNLRSFSVSVIQDQVHILLK